MWKNKPVVVTGGAGMVGSQLVEELVLAGAEVIVADDFSRGMIRVPGATYIVPSNVSDYRFCEWLFQGQGRRDNKVFAVFNLAAKVAGVIHNQKNHLDMFHSNVALQTVPLMAAEEVGVEHFLQVSSVCVYAEEHQSPCLESNGIKEEPHLANYGYAWSKRIGEKMLQVADIPHAVIVRPSNIFGPHDYFDELAHVIPALIKRTILDDEVMLYGDPSATREFIYSRDVAKGMMKALERGYDKRVYNLGCNGENVVTILELAELIQSVMGVRRLIHRLEDEPLSSGDMRRYSDSSLAHKELNWKHETTLEDGLRAVIDWYGRQRTPDSA